jgi:hypothetical protein
MDPFERDLGAVLGVKVLVVLQQKVEKRVSEERADVAPGARARRCSATREAKSARP